MTYRVTKKGKYKSVKIITADTFTEAAMEWALRTIGRGFTAVPARYGELSVESMKDLETHNYTIISTPETI